MSDDRKQLADFTAQRILENDLEGAIEALLQARQRSNVLTIVANKGPHHLPREFMRGEVIYATEGVLDFSSKNSVKEELTRMVKKLLPVIRSKNWDEVYLIPFGHSVFSMAIKHLVYRISRKETIDVFYSPEWGYADIDIKLRPLIS